MSETINGTVDANAVSAEAEAVPIVYAAGGAVQSVNGKTGAVVLNASDVHALPDDTEIPTVTNDFTNEYKQKVDDLYADYLSASGVIG